MEPNPPSPLAVSAPVMSSSSTGSISILTRDGWASWKRRVSCSIVYGSSDVLSTETLIGPV